MPDPLESRRQGMQQEAADKLFRRYGHLSALLPILGPVLLVLESDLAVIHILYPVIADGDAMGVAAQIIDDLLGTAKGRLGIDDPLAAAQRSQ